MDVLGLDKMWDWIRELVPNPGLETFRLHAFTTMGQTSIPPPFILNLAVIHRDTLKHFMVGDAQLSLIDIGSLGFRFPKLETLVCSVGSSDVVRWFH